MMSKMKIVQELAFDHDGRLIPLESQTWINLHSIVLIREEKRYTTIEYERGSGSGEIMVSNKAREFVE
jgi:hypothetical protein